MKLNTYFVALLISAKTIEIAIFEANLYNCIICIIQILHKHPGYFTFFTSNKISIMGIVHPFPHP